MKNRVPDNSELQQTAKTFAKDGVVLLPGIFHDWVDTLRSGIERNLENLGVDAKIYTGEGGGRFIGDYCNWQRIPEFQDFIYNSSAAQLGAQLMNSKEVRLFHEHVLVKEASTDVKTPWHHDMPYYCVDADKTISFWIPLDDVPRERTLEFVPGSHATGKLFRPDRFNGDALNQDDGLDAVPNIEADRQSFNIAGWAMQPGDAVAFDFRTLHGAPANQSRSELRRAFSLRLVGDNARFRRPAGISSPPFRDVTLAQGAPLDGPEFPQLQ